MKNLRKEFPIVDQLTYLNTAYSGPLSIGLVTHRRAQDQQQLMNASLYRHENDTLFDSVKRTVASCFGAANASVVLTQNFSVGINTIFNGLSTSNKILLLQDDYPAMQIAVESKGFCTKYVAWDDNLKENLKKTIDQYQPNVFAFSIVHYISGAKIAADFLKDLKKTYPNLLLIADATQFCGISNFNFDDSGIDILGSSGYKWLLGGYGNGFFIFKENVLEAITPNSYKKSIATSSAPDSYKSLEACFQPGHLDTLNFHSLEYSLKLLQKIGFNKIENQLKNLATKLWSELDDLNLVNSKLLNWSNQSNIINIPGDDSLFKTLTKEKIICSQRGSGIRLSFHFYNTDKDIEHVISVLKNAV
ncbi:aminotransferase class V-fold PLP-dependent enzyme [Aquimarina sp. W85]|uniref:aminotransferase class V-fold PLP-dependent enzyme n=1 Tax=Aquimarina rhodophyticola TaxID=3342246 RepID=UPI00366C2384